MRYVRSAICRVCCRGGCRLILKSGRLHPLPSPALSTQRVNANGSKAVQLKDFKPEELKRLNATLQLDWKLYEHFLPRPRPW